MRKYKSYTEEFKREAVARSQAVGVATACEELGITSSTIYGWIKKYSDLPSSRGSVEKPSYEELEKEVRKLKKELGYMEEINKVLKKSTAIFSLDQFKK
jgi:transposase-like protein